MSNSAEYLLPTLISISGIIIITLIITSIIVTIFTYKSKRLKDLDIKEPLKELSAARSVQEIASSQISILSGYYNNVLIQSQRSFYFALFAAGIGLLFFITAGGILLTSDLKSLALITTLGGALSAFVSGVNFHIYNKSSSQLIDFHQRLDMTQRFLLSDGLCNSIKDPAKQDSTRADIIMTIVGKDLKNESKSQEEAKR